jgi:hypothetical protein
VPQPPDDADLEIDSVWFGIGLPGAGSDGRLGHFNASAVDAATSASASAAAASTSDVSGSSSGGLGRFTTGTGSGDKVPHISAAAANAALLSAVLSDEVALTPAVAGVATLHSQSMAADMMMRAAGGHGAKGASTGSGGGGGGGQPSLPPREAAAEEARKRLSHMTLLAPVADIDAGTRSKVRGMAGGCSCARACYRGWPTPSAFSTPQVLHTYLHRRLKEYARRIAAMRALRRDELQVGPWAAVGGGAML